MNTPVEVMTALAMLELEEQSDEVHARIRALPCGDLLEFSEILRMLVDCLHEYAIDRKEKAS
jgi:hypothetical protein